MYLVFRMIPTQNNNYLPLEISTIGLPKGTIDPKWVCVVHNVDLFQSWKFNLNFFLSLFKIQLLCAVTYKNTIPSPEK